MIIKSDKIYMEDGTWAKGTITTVDGRIDKIHICDCGDTCNCTKDDDTVVDASGMYVIPGLVDIHFHGSVGYDLCDGSREALDAMMEYQLKQGVTSTSPATMTLSREELAGIFTTIGEYAKDQAKGKLDMSSRSTLRGITMEGPFVSLAKKGAQNGDYIHKPDVEFYRQMQELSGGMISQIAVAPEEDEELSFTKEISKERVISVAHTTAGFDIADASFKNGASHVTHLYNAMPSFLHRDPGVVGAAADNSHVYVEMICDGVHLHPAMVRSMFTLFGPDRICMISDSMRAVGLEDGMYTLGGQDVQVVGKKATLADGTIAGSASNLMDCLRVAVKEMGIPLEDVIKACTLTPAKSLGFDNECGSIVEGKVADFVILDKDLNIVRVIKG